MFVGQLVTREKGCGYWFDQRRTLGSGREWDLEAELLQETRYSAVELGQLYVQVRVQVCKQQIM